MWGVWSVIAGLGAVVFKYVAFPALGFGFAALLIGLYQGRAMRRKWWCALTLSLSLVLLAGLALASHALQIVETDHTETNIFLSGGLQQLFQPPYGLHLLGQASAQVGTHGLLWASSALLGLFVLHRERGSWRWWTWLALIVSVLFHFWFMPSYLWWQFLVPRYSVPMSAFILLAVVCGLVWASEAVARISRWPSASSVVLPLAVSLWIVPQAAETLRLTWERLQPVLPALLAQWGGRTLPDCRETILVYNSRSFDWYSGGYDGPCRPWVEARVTDRPLTEWLALDVRYAEIRPQERAALESDPAGSALLSELTFLKRLPRSDVSLWWDSTEVYWIGRMKHTLAAQAPHFGPISLVSYDWQVQDRSLSLRFAWRAASRPTADYALFVHLVAADGDSTPLTQWDGPPAQGHRPTSTWDDPGETLLSSPVNLSLDGLTQGCYQVRIGLYDAAGRLALEDEADAWVIPQVLDTRR